MHITNKPLDHHSQHITSVNLRRNAVREQQCDAMLKPLLLSCSGSRQSSTSLKEWRTAGSRLDFEYNAHTGVMSIHNNGILQAEFEVDYWGVINVVGDDKLLCWKVPEEYRPVKFFISLDYTNEWIRLVEYTGVKIAAGCCKLLSGNMCSVQGEWGLE